jgi:hypothetical protein
VNCNQELCIELWSVINFHREIEPANLLQYILFKVLRLMANVENPKCLSCVSRRNFI